MNIILKISKKHLDDLYSVGIQTLNNESLKIGWNKFNWTL